MDWCRDALSSYALLTVLHSGTMESIDSFIWFLSVHSHITECGKVFCDFSLT